MNTDNIFKLSIWFVYRRIFIIQKPKVSNISKLRAAIQAKRIALYDSKKALGFASSPLCLGSTTPRTLTRIATSHEEKLPLRVLVS